MGKVMSESVAECLTRFERNMFLAGDDLAMRRKVRMMKIGYLALWFGIDLTFRKEALMKLHNMTLNPYDSDTKLKIGTVIGHRALRYGLGVVSRINGVRDCKDEIPLNSHHIKTIFFDVVYEMGMVSRNVSMISILGVQYDVYKNCIIHMDIERLEEKADVYRALKIRNDARDKAEKNKAIRHEKTP